MSEPGPKVYKIQLVNGDITQQSADVIVSTIHRSKKLSACIISHNVMRKAGTSLQNELDKIDGELSMGQVVSTAPGNLRTFVSSIFFVCLLSWQEGNDEALKSSVTECLNEASSHKYRSIAFPALGMGGFKYPQYKVAMAMCKAIVDYFILHPSTSLETVYIVLPFHDLSQRASIQSFLQSAMGFLEGHNHTDPDQSKLATVNVAGVEAFNGLEGQRVRAPENRSLRLPSMAAVSQSAVDKLVSTATQLPSSVASFAGNPSPITWSVQPGLRDKWHIYVTTTVEIDWLTAFKKWWSAR
ncbi:protein mono-ADP-ribosyltransferase PARP14-like [Physella acuta]|uniref:protein mono-ADP-ribosyltransferase PARP14-like n=1 Tax=Physella acuta TaxID=109671 RepID=UPI0027DC60C5|nr:protein mono-ADP-ribosyltransferase PARP14-like [Physella acuta]